MQSISVKVNDSVQTIAEAKVITKDGQPTIIKANRNANYELINDATGRGPDHIVTKRVGKDLHVSFEESAEESDLIIENFYDYDKSALIGQAESGQYHYYVPDTGLTQDYVTELVIGDIEGQALGGQGYPAPWWIGAEEGSRFGIMPWLVGLAGVVAAGVALKGDNDNNNSKAPVADTQTPTPQPKPLPVELKIGPSQNPTDAKLSIMLSEGAEKISIDLPGLTPIETTIDALKALDTNPASNTYDISINQLVSPGLANYSLSLVDYQKVIDNIKNGQAVKVTAKKEGFTDGKADDAVTQTPDVDAINKDGDNFATINPKPNITNASEVTVSYTPSSGNANPQTITATKVGDSWQATTGANNTPISTITTADAPADKPSIDPATGVISIPTSLVNTSQYTPVTAQVTKTTDNKPSLQNNVDLPDTPSVNIPTINSGETDYPIAVSPGKDNTSIVTSYTDEAGKPQTITVTKNPDGSYSATQDGKPVKTTPTDDNTPWVNTTNGVLILPKDSVDNNKPVTTIGKTDNGSAQDATNPANTPKVVANNPTATQTGLPQQADIVATPGEGNTKTSTTYTDEQGNTKTITATYDPATNTWTAKNPNEPTQDLPTTNTDGKTPYIDPQTGSITFPPASVDNAKPVTMVGEKEGGTPTIATASPAQSPNVAVKPPVTGQKDGDIVATPGDDNTQTQTTYTPEGSNKPVTITATKVDTNNDGVPDTWTAKNPNEPTQDLPTTNTDGKTPYIDPQTGSITFPPASVDNAKPVTMVGEKEGSIPSVYTIDLTDKTAPIIENIKVDVAVNGAGDKIVLTYDEPLDANNPPPATSFTVTVDGKKVIPTVEVSGNTVILNVPTPILKDQEVKVAYNKPADTKDAIQDQAGNDADSLTSTPAKNNSTMVDTDKDGIPDSQDDDDDNDGVTDADEKLVGTDPTNPTSDGNTPDGKLDSDGDGISNDDESVTKAEDPTATNTDKPTDKDGDGKPDIATAKVPTKPATAPDMTDATDTGVSNSDNITTNKTPSFSVPKPTDGEPVLVINGKIVESTSTPDPKNPNNVILTPKQPLFEGVSQIATATKKGSQVSDPSEPVVVTVDTTAPTGTTATLDPDSDTGVKGDNITSDTTPTIKGTGNKGDTVIATFPAQNGGAPEVVEVKVDEKGEWSATPTKELKDGANTISVSVKDPAGNVGVVNPAVITINTTKPTATATLDPNSDSGDKGDGITNNTMPKITGKGKEGDTIKVTFPSKDGTPEEKTVTVGKGGTWEVVPTKALKEGENQIGVEVTDKTTGTKTDLPVVKVTVDTTAPTGTTATLDPDSDTGVKGDNITSDTTPTIKGTGNKGDTVIATFPAQNGGAPEVVEVKVDEKGEWSATPTKELKDGANTISVSVKDPAGNVGVVNPAVITINTTKPTATATLDPNSDSGDKGDGITNNTMPKITGKGKEGDTIKVTFPSKDGTPEEKTVTVGKGGTWEVVPTKALKEGENQIGVEVTDKTTGTKTDLPVVKVTVDTTAPTGTTATLDPDSDTGVKGDNITSDTTPTIKGTGNKGDTVIATFPAQNGGAPEVVEVKVDEKGEWSATPTKELKDGANTISVSVKDPAGNVGVVNPAVITINTTKPTATATLDPNSDSGDKGDGITNNTMPKITGKGKEGDTIKVTFPSKDGTPEEKTVTVGKGGTWEVVPTKALKEGENQIGVEVTDKTTGTKTDLPVVKVTVDTTAPTGTTATLDPDSDTGVKGDNITSDTTPTIKGTGNKGDTVIATFPAQNGGAPEVVEVKVDEKGEWSATPTKELKDGANTISVSVKDPAGNVGVVNPAVITINTTKPTAPTPVANSDGSVTADLPKDPQDGDTVTISYTPEQGANKTATLKYDGATKTWKPDPANGDVQVVDGKATLPADKVKDNSLVKVSAADKAGNESPATPATTVSAKAPASAGVQNDGVVDNTGKTAVDEGQTISTKVTLTNANGNPALKLEYTGAADKDDIGTPTFTGYDETNGKITYDATNGTINVPKGVGSFTIVTPINADGKTEAAENITVKVGGVDANQAITINDTSKGAATIDNSANDGVKTKPASEGGNLVTTVKLVAGKETELAITRTAGTATDDDFDTPVYTVTKKADGSTATVGATLTFANGKLTVPAGVTEFTITTPVKTDNLSEGNETVKYTVGGVDGNEAIITDTTPAVAVKSVTNANNATEVNEGASLTTTVTLNRATDKQIELDYKQNLMGSTAEDFTSGKPTFTAGVSLSADGTKLIVPKGVSTFDITTTVKADNVTEATAESFNYTVGGKTSSTVTINDTSKGAATIDNSANDGVKTKPASEGGNLVTTVKLVAGKETELAITRTAGTATDDDFDTPVYTVTKKADGSTATVGATLTFANGKLTVPAGVTEFTITTPVKTDNLSEGNETVKYTVGGVDGNEAIITDTTPAVAVKSVTNANNATEVNEGASLTTTVTLNRATDKQIELDYKQNLMGSTAEDFTSGKPTFTAGVSLSADGTKLIVPKGVSTFDITTTVKADNVTEATAESFNYTVGGKTSSTVTINDTSKGAATIDNSANDGVKTKPASEGGNLVTTVKLVAGKETELAITRTAGTATDDDFDTPVYTVTKKADGSTATVGATLTFANGKLTVPAGVTEFTITTPVKTDNLSEGNETVKYTVGGVDGNEAIITDTTPAVAVKSVTNANNATEVNEGASLTTTVTLNRATDKQIELDYKQNLMGSTAEDFTSGKPTFTAGVSLSADGTKLIVPKGVSTFDITTTVKADNVTEATAESFNYTVGGKTSSTVTINDTSKGAATIDNSANDGVKTKPASEGGNLVTTVKLVAGKETELAITRTAGTATDDDFDTPVYTVTKKADGSTATVGATLTFANGKLTVPAGVTEFTITTPVKTDNLSEGNETVKYTVGGVDGNEAIITDTTPAVAVKSVTNANNATEVNEGASLTTTVTLNRATDKQIELDYKQNLMGSTAEDFTSGKPTFTAGVSLSADGTKLIVPKGVSTFDITTTVKADNVTEATAESFNYTVGGKTSSTVTINDTSKGAATIDNSANDGVKTKPASEGGNLVTTVKLVAGKETELAITRTAGTATDDDFDTPVYTVTKKADGSTATVGATLTFANGKLTVPAGVTEFTITTPVKTDNLSEGNETVKYTVGGVDGNEAIITDTTPAVAVKSVTNANNATEVNEGASLTTTVTLNRATDKQIELDYKQNLMGSTAEDFTSGKPTFTAGVSLSADGTKLIVPKGVSTFDITTTVKADNVTEATAESFNYTVGGKTSSTVTINDTSKGAATIDNSANDGVKTKPASEGGNLVTTVKLVAGKETELAITRTAGTATDDDFDTPVYTVTKKADGSTATVGATLTFANGKLTVPAGVTEFTITTPVKTDNLSEGNETVKYTVGGVDGNEAIITDTTPAVAVKSVTNANNATEVNEGASLTTTVTLNRATDKQIELDYKQNLMGSTAEDFTSGKPTFTAGVSLSADGTKLIVPKGVSTFDITTTVKADNVTEATAESFNYTVGGKTSSTVTINDTSKGAATIDNSANDGVKTKPASEGGNLVTTVKLVAGKETELAITRTAGTATDDDFDTPVYTVTKKADGSTATVGATLTFANGKLTVPAGVTEFTITTPVKTDNLSEGNETVKYTVGGVDGNEAIITDTTPAVAVKSVTNANNATEVNEGASLTTTVTLNRATDKQIELDYKQNLMGSTAEDFTSGKPTFTAGVSLSADGTKLIVPKGVSTFDITTTVKADNVTEATAESFNYTVGGKTSSTVTINDTSKGAATIDNSANDGVKTKPASEGGNLVTTVKLVAGKETELAITRTAGTATDDDFDTPVYTVTKKADGSTATVGATLTFANGKLTVPAGVTEFTITTPVKTDNLSEGNETVKYTVGGVDGNEAIITDTTPAVAVKSVTNANNATEVNEGASLTTTVTLNRATDKQIELDYKQNLMGSTAEDFTSGKPTFTAGVSLSADGTKLIVPKGVSTFDITTTVKADNVTEATAESFNYTVGGKTSSTVTINDTSKGAATIDNSANDGVKTKPASEGGNLVTTVKLVAGKETELAITRTAGTATDDDFDTPVYTVTKKADGSTATVGATLTFANGKLTVPAGVTEFTITTPVKTDNLSEGNETVKYTVGGVDGNEAIITDTTPAVAVKSVTNANNATEVNEGASLTTTVTLNRATDKQIELDYKQNLMGSTAEDFTSGKPTFTAGVSLSADGTKLIVPKGVSTFDITTTVKADNVTEATAESFNYTVGGKTSSTVTINDTSKGAATIDNSANDGVKTKPASEGGNLVTTVKLVAGKETELAITRTAGTATDDDFDTPVYTVTKKADGSTATVGATLTFANGKLTVPAGVTEFTITTPVKTDNLSEGNETVKYTVGGVDGNEAIITDTTPAVAVKSVTNANNATEVNEGASLTTTVTLNRATDKQIELDYKQNLMGSTAEDFTSGKPTFTAGVSLSADGTKLIVPKGVSTFDITTTVKADNVTEATAESFNYTVGGKTSSTVTINDTSKGAATIDNSANDGVKTKPASEGGNLVTTVKLVAGKETELAITRTAGTATDDDFDTPVYTVTKKADGSTATVGATLTFANGKLTVPAGVTEFTITTPVKTDNLSEGNETVKYTVGGVDGNEAIITDTTPAVAVKSVTNANNATEVNEGASLTTTVTLNRATDKQIELDYKQNLMGSTAEDFTSGKPTFTAGVSLSADGTKLIVPKGVSTFDITTTVKADNVTEATAESFNYTVGGKTSSTVTINDTSKKPAPTQISSLTINDDDGTGNDVGIDGQYVGRIADGAVTNDTTPTLTITLNQALQDNETLELVRYIKDPITKNLIVDGTFTRKTPAKSSSDDKIYTLEDDLQSVTTAGTDYVYKARVFDSNTKEEFAEKTESMRLDTVAEQAVVTSYDPKTHILKGVSKEIGGTIFVSKDGNGKYSSAPKAVVAENGEWTMQLEGNDIPKDQNSVNNIYWSRRDKNDIPVAISMIDKAGNQPKSIISDLYAFYNNEYADGSGREGSFSAADTPISSTGKQMPSGAGNERRGDIDNNKTKNYLTSWDDSDVDNQTIYARQITTYDTKQRNAFDVSMGKGDDALYVAGDVTSNIRIDMGDGNDYLYTGGEFGTGHGGVNTILHMGAGNDTVKIEKNSYITTMTLGDGNDDLRMGGQLGNYSTIDAGNGNDHVHISGHKNNIAVNAHSKIDMGDGNDTLVIGYNISTDSTINLGAGNDAFHYGYGRLDGKVDGGEGTDVLRVFNTANQNVVISSDNITNFERVDITGEKHYVNTFRATDKLFVNNNFAEHGVNKDMLLDGDTANSKLELLDSSFWNKVSTSLADANGNAVAKKAEDMFTLDDGRTVKGTVVNGDTKYYYTNQEGDITGERYEGNIYNVYTTANDESKRLLVDLDITII